MIEQLVLAHTNIIQQYDKKYLFLFFSGYSSRHEYLVITLTSSTSIPSGSSTADEEDERRRQTDRDFLNHHF